MNSFTLQGNLHRQLLALAGFQKQIIMKQMHGLLKLLVFLSKVLLAVLIFNQTVLAFSLLDQRIKVYGIWQDDQLVVYKLKFRDRRVTQYGIISGVVSDFNPEKQSFKLGPYSIVWNDKTKFTGQSLEQLSNGYSVKIKGRQSKTGQIIAKRIEPGSSEMAADTLKILGFVSNVQRQKDGFILATILGETVYIPAEQVSSAYLLTRKQDDRRPDDQLKVEVFGRPLTIGGEVGVTPRYRHNFNLNPDKNRDRVRLDTEAQIELFYVWNPNLAFFTEGQLNYQQDLYRGNNGTTRGDVEFKRGETWMFWGEILQSNFSLQVGRQNFRETREWWWDEDLDAVRLYYSRPFFHFEVGIAEQLFAVSTNDEGIDPEEKDVLRILSHASWEWSNKQRLGLFFLHQHDYSRTERIKERLREEFEDDNDGDFTWLGLRSQNRFSIDNVGDFGFWADGAWMKGTERNINFDESDIKGISVVDSVEKQKLEGWALDVGLTWELPLSWSPSLTFGYAIGTDDFRQTGLQDNNDRFRAVSRFRYYGELLRPELANLQIWTAAATVPFLQNSSVSVLYHNYRQVKASDSLRKGRIDSDPNGISPSIGQEWDVVVALEEWKHWEMEFVAGVFRAGSAYGEQSGNVAVTAIFKVNYNF